MLQLIFSVVIDKSTIYSIGPVIEYSPLPCSLFNLCSAATYYTPLDVNVNSLFLIDKRLKPKLPEFGGCRFCVGVCRSVSVSLCFLVALQIVGDNVPLLRIVLFIVNQKF